MEPSTYTSTIEASCATSQVCFLCQERSDMGSDGSNSEIEMKLLSSRMPHSKARILRKIENILGRNFNLVVENDEVICESCFKILVRIDNMEMVIKTFLSVKYNLDNNDESLLITGDNNDPLDLGETINEVNTFYVVEADNDSTFAHCSSPVNIYEEHNYNTLPNLNDPKQDEYSNTVDRNTMLVELGPEPTKEDDAFNSLPDSSKIEPIDMTQHELDIADTSNGYFTCAKCRQRFTCIYSLRRHLVKHSAKQETCRICLKIAPDKIFLKIHIRQVHMKEVDTLRKSGWTKPLALTCPQCPYQASEVLTLVRHINNIHNKPRVRDVKRRCRDSKSDKKQLKKDPNKSNLQEEYVDDWSDTGQFGREITIDGKIKASNSKPNKGSKSQVISRSLKSVLAGNSKEVDDFIDLMQETCQMEKGTSIEETVTSDSVTPETESQENAIAPSAPQTSVGWDSSDKGKSILSKVLTGQEMRPCPICNDKLYKKGNLAHHMKGHDSKPVGCRVCDVILEDRALHTLHMQKVHNEGAEEELAAFQVDGGYRCPECGRVVTKPASFQAHMRLHRDELSFRCLVCLEVMQDRESLQAHWQTAHPQPTGSSIVPEPSGKPRKRPVQHQCLTCETKLSSVSRLKIHMAGHDGKQAKCSRCDEIFADKHFMRQHIRAAHYELWEAQKDILSVVRTCTVCSKELSSDHTLKRHMAGHDPTSEPLSCLICNTQLQDRLHRRVHMVQVHPGRTLPQFACSECTEVFRTKTGIQRHIAYKHTEMKCRVCGKMFSEFRRFREHERRHKHSGPGPVKCLICPKSWATQFAMRRHMKNHETVKSHLCAVCGKAFKAPSSLHQHMGVHESVDRYTCEICGRTFMYRASLQMHRKWHDNPYPFPCPHESCSRSYKNQSHLKNHIRTMHSKERPFQCTFCPKAFNNRVTFKQHVMSHTRVFSHNCEHCDYGTSRLEYLLTHYRNKHGDEATIAALKPKKCTYKLCLRPEEMEQSDEAVATETLLPIDELLADDSEYEIGDND